jgi:hypothetical protein
MKNDVGKLQRNRETSMLTRNSSGRSHDEDRNFPNHFSASFYFNLLEKQCLNARRKVSLLTDMEKYFLCLNKVISSSSSFH